MVGQLEFAANYRAPENGYTVFDEMLYFGWVSLRERHRDTFKDGKRIPSEIPPRDIALTGIRADRWDEEVYQKYENPPGLSWEDRHDRPMYQTIFAYPGPSGHGGNRPVRP